MFLSRASIDLINVLLDHFVPESFGEDWDDPESHWPATAAAIQRVRNNPTVEQLAAEPLVQEEFDNRLTFDEYLKPPYYRLPNAEGLHIERDMCRVGARERYDPEAYSTHRPRTLVVDGVRYIIG